jgi:transposase
MTEDTCGYDTPNGPCQNPATEGDSCWIESHGGHVSGHGRPSKLDDYEEDILTGARQGMTLAGCARLAGVDESTLHRWINKYDEFRKSLKRARAQGELQHLQSVNDSGSQFILERSFGYTKTEKREIEGGLDLSGVVADFEDTDT